MSQQSQLLLQASQKTTSMCRNQLTCQRRTTESPRTLLDCESRGLYITHSDAPERAVRRALRLPVGHTPKHPAKAPGPAAIRPPQAAQCVLRRLSASADGVGGSGYS